MAPKTPGWRFRTDIVKIPSRGDGAVPKHAVQRGCRTSVLGGFQYLKTLDKAMSIACSVGAGNKLTFSRRLN